MAAVLGEAWLPMVLTMQVLAAYGLRRSIASTFVPVWQAIGRPDYLTKVGTLAIVLMALLIYPATAAFAIAGTSAMLVGVNLVAIYPIDAIVTARAIDFRLTQMLRELSYPAMASAVMGASVLYVRNLFNVGIPLVELVVLIVVGAVTYVAFVAILETQFGWGLREEFRQVRSAL